MPVEEPHGSPPFRAVGFLLSSLGYATSRGFHRTLEHLALDPRSFSVLRAVGFNQGQTQNALATALSIPASRMVAILDGLESKGLLERRFRDNDRRSRAVHLTDAGNTLLRKAFEVAMGFEKSLCEGLSDSERDRLIGLLERVAQNLGLGPGAHAALRETHDPPS
jgi:DNA-binding MarR family transcriptional regulator